ncbi:MAG: hypothetical protein ACK54K_09805 [Gemmatimonadaceae bacterium]
MAQGAVAPGAVAPGAVAPGVAVAGVASSGVAAPPLPADSAGLAGRYAIIAAGSVAAATWNQAVGLPDAWPRTWRGYGARLGDQAGFAVAEEALRAGIGVLVPWHGGRSPCPQARRGHPLGRRVAAATRCAVHDRLVAQNAAGEARPNVPFLGAVAGASAISLAWRPERADARQGQLFVASRIGIVLAGAVAKGMWEAWREQP